MAVSQVSNTAVLIQGTQTNNPDLTTVTETLFKNYACALAAGTGDGQANCIWSDTVTLAASGTADLDFAASLTSTISGATLTFTKIKLLLVSAAAANTNNVVVSRPASNGVVLFSAASDAVSVLPGGIFLLTAPAAGITVTAATGDLITFTNSSSGTGVTYDVIVIGIAS